MASTAANQRPRRGKPQLPHCYYEGFVDKKTAKEKAYRRFWTSLCGNTLFFFNNAKDSTYVEKLELSSFISLTDDSSRDRNLEAGKLNLRMREGEIKLMVPTLEARELWKGYIYSVVELSVPSSLTLLPGQVHMLREVVEKESERRKLAPSSSLYLDLTGTMPKCFVQVSRTEAEVLLERNSHCGNLLLRPGRDGTSLAVTTRQELHSGAVFRHYRVTRQEQGGFLIDVDNPIACASLQEVINCLIEKTAGTLEPFVMEAPYEDSISFIQSDGENGEKTLQSVAGISSLTPPALPPKTVAGCGPLPDLPLQRSSSSVSEESLYLNEPNYSAEKETPATATVVGRPPQPPPKPKKPTEPAATLPLPPRVPWSNPAPCEKKALKPPFCAGPGPVALKPAVPVKPRNSVGPADHVTHMITEELRIKLQKRLASQE
ncbi:signal-transducing adaptor protein 2a isoform X1 [Amia ocellicauda]|uniref:signal-transducing adaptor protein 2a isoform X1 n=1 Tax=Amia ocellicauda TaxID=2972642 RepID=UPI003464CF52